MYYFECNFQNIEGSFLFTDLYEMANFINQMAASFQTTARRMGHIRAAFKASSIFTLNTFRYFFVSEDPFCPPVLTDFEAFKTIHALAQRGGCLVKQTSFDSFVLLPELTSVSVPFQPGPFRTNDDIWCWHLSNFDGNEIPNIVDQNPPWTPWKASIQLSTPLPFEDHYPFFKTFLIGKNPLTKAASQLSMRFTSSALKKNSRFSHFDSEYFELQNRKCYDLGIELPVIQTDLADFGLFDFTPDGSIFFQESSRYRTLLNPVPSFPQAVPQHEHV